eukprot:2703230-Prymnesium_polylepis.2
MQGPHARARRHTAVCPHAHARDSVPAAARACWLRAAPWAVMQSSRRRAAPSRDGRIAVGCRADELFSIIQALPFDAIARPELGAL